MEQLTRIESAHFGGGHGSALVAPDPSNAIRVTVAWTPSSDDSAKSFAPTEVELVAGIAADPTTTWTCRERFAANWVEAIASARCSEVVLTARLGDDLPGKHRVLELAELLTHELAATQPLIRVRFLPTASKRRWRSRPRLTGRATKNPAQHRGA
ncbi:MAG TPA: hypothetical protein VNW92_10510 [Polyangiaceae bacterium]|jgi:hypothetical protein|nr:hypothetical protein [Polyangiaceae bacterium]